MLGDATLDANLREVGIDRAKGIIATLSWDADNLFLVMSAKTLNPKLQISARVFEEEAEAKMRRAGADTVLTPYTSRIAIGTGDPEAARCAVSRFRNDRFGRRYRTGACLR